MSEEDASQQHWDVVVVGAGSAGVTLAARLGENPDCTVLLIESGPLLAAESDHHQLRPVTFATKSHDWGLTAFVRPDREGPYPQGRLVGGGSAVNGAIAFRPMPEDFDYWPETWSWERMLPAFRRLENDLDFADRPWHGTSGPIPITRWQDSELTGVQQAFRDACVRAGHPPNPDQNRPNTWGVGPLPMNRRAGLRISSALGYLETISERPNLAVLSDTHVDRVLFSDTRAIGILASQQQRPVEIFGNEIVIAAGAIQTPCILWRSGIGPAAPLARLGATCRTNLPGVGANLHDHTLTMVFCQPAQRGSIASPPSQVSTRFSSAHGTRFDMFVGVIDNWDLSRSPSLSAIAGTGPVLALTSGIQEPRSRGRVIPTSLDPLVPPRIELNMLEDGADLQRTLEGLRFCRDLAVSRELSPYVDRILAPVPGLFDDDDLLGTYARSVVTPWFHPVGTCRMGPTTDPVSVVDDQLQVLGTDRLRVVDASVMPRICRAPTNLTAIAIAERAAELMLGGR